MGFSLKDLEKRFNLFDTDGKLIVGSLIEALDFVYNHLGENVVADKNGDLEVGRNLEVDGTATINTKLELGSSAVLGENFLSKVGGTKLYKHKLTLNWKQGFNTLTLLEDNFYVISPKASAMTYSDLVNNHDWFIVPNSYIYVDNDFIHYYFIGLAELGFITLSESGNLIVGGLSADSVVNDVFVAL